MNQQEIEIASWRMVTELHRRNPSKLSIIEMHPGGGQSDCLALMTRDAKILGMLNRGGSFHNCVDSRRIEAENIWASENTDAGGLRRLLGQLSEMMRLPIPTKLPPTTPETLTYRLIAAFLAHAYGGRDYWECRNGLCDSSGSEGSFVQDDLFAAFPSVERLVPTGTFEFLNYRFWFLRKNGQPMLCLETSGCVHLNSGKKVDLMPIYHADRRIWPVIAKVALDLLP